MSRCGGFVRELQTQEGDQLQLRLSTCPPPQKRLPCYPSTVIYGHTSSRGLDINRWTIGLDSGCVGGKRLSALILGPDPSPYTKAWEGHDHEAGADREVKFGEYGRGMIVQVSCRE